jgi:hypothetical protein
MRLFRKTSIAALSRQMYIPKDVWGSGPKLCATSLVVQPLSVPFVSAGYENTCAVQWRSPDTRSPL